MVPQIIFLVFSVIALTASGILHGEKKQYQEYNFWATLLNILLWTGLLWWGGFFEPLANL